MLPLPLSPPTVDVGNANAPVPLTVSTVVVVLIAPVARMPFVTVTARLAPLKVTAPVPMFKSFEVVLMLGWGALTIVPGDPASAGTFTQRGVIQQRTDATSISVLLNQSVPLGQDVASLADALNTLLRRVPGITNQSLANKVLG